MIDRLKTLFQFALWFHWRLIKKITIDKLFVFVFVLMWSILAAGMLFQLIDSFTGYKMERKMLPYMENKN